jgi:hypothetical protein
LARNHTKQSWGVLEIKRDDTGLEHFKRIGIQGKKAHCEITVAKHKNTVKKYKQYVQQLMANFVSFCNHEISMSVEPLMTCKDDS